MAEGLGTDFKEIEARMQAERDRQQRERETAQHQQQLAEAAAAEYKQQLEQRDQLTHQVEQRSGSLEQAKQLGPEIARLEEDMGKTWAEMTTLSAINLEEKFTKVQEDQERASQLLTNLDQLEPSDEITQLGDQLRTKLRKCEDDLKKLNETHKAWQMEVQTLFQPILDRIQVSQPEVWTRDAMVEAYQAMGQALNQKRELKARMDQLFTEIDAVDTKLLDLVENPQVLHVLKEPIAEELAGWEQEKVFREKFTDKLLKDSSVQKRIAEYPMQESLYREMAQAFLDIELTKYGLNDDKLTVAERAQRLTSFQNDLLKRFDLRAGYHDRLTDFRDFDRNDAYNEGASRRYKAMDPTIRFEDIDLPSDILLFTYLAEAGAGAPGRLSSWLYHEAKRKGVPWPTEYPEGRQFIAERVKEYLPLLNVMKAYADAENERFGTYQQQVSQVQRSPRLIDPNISQAMYEMTTTDMFQLSNAGQDLALVPRNAYNDRGELSQAGQNLVATYRQEKAKFHQVAGPLIETERTKALARVDKAKTTEQLLTARADQLKRDFDAHVALRVEVRDLSSRRTSDYGPDGEIKNIFSDLAEADRRLQKFLVGKFDTKADDLKKSRLRDLERYCLDRLAFQHRADLVRRTTGKTIELPQDFKTITWEEIKRLDIELANILGPTYGQLVDREHEYKEYGTNYSMDQARREADKAKQQREDAQQSRWYSLAASGRPDYYANQAQAKEDPRVSGRTTIETWRSTGQ